jgi:hypothetical protein
MSYSEIKPFAIEVDFKWKMDKTSSWRADLILKTGVAAKKEQVEVSDCFGLFLVFNLKL